MGSETIADLIERRRRELDSTGGRVSFLALKERGGHRLNDHTLRKFAAPGGRGRAPWRSTMLLLAEVLDVGVEEIREAFLAGGYRVLPAVPDVPGLGTAGGSPSTIQDLIGQRLLALGKGAHALSYRAAAQRSGGLVASGTIHRIHAGYSLGPWSEQIVQGLALALDVPEADVAHAANASTRRARNRVVWPLKYSGLSEQGWAQVRALADQLLISEAASRQGTGRPG